MKTTSQIAKELGITRQAVQQRIDKLGLELEKNNRGWYIINSEQEQLIKGSDYTASLEDSVEQARTSKLKQEPNKDKLEIDKQLLERIESLEQDKKHLQEQAVSKDNQIETLQRLLDQQQQLQLKTIQELELLKIETKEQETTKENKSLLQRLFKS